MLLTMTFDKIKEYTIHRTSKDMRPLLEALFGEMMTLGFVSVVAFVLGESR